MKRPRRPGDFNQRAKTIVDLATQATTEDDVNSLPLMGRELSGEARNQAVSPERRSEIARMGGQAGSENLDLRTRVLS